MSAIENRQKSLSEDLQIPGLVQSAEPVEQLSFPGNPITPPPVSLTQEPDSLPGLADIDTVCRPIANTKQVDPSTPPPVSSADVALLETRPVVAQPLANAPAIPRRPPVIISGSKEKKSRSLRPPQGRRHVIGIAALVLLLVITGGTLYAVSPLGRDTGLGFDPFASNSSLVQGGNSNNLSLIGQQATATAVVHQQNDGYDPNANSGGPVVTGSPENWPLGVCTYWANYEYHKETGYWVTWIGNAYQWADGARLAGWHVSTSPHVPSIIVLEPGVEGAGGYGHVAVVESMVNSTTVHTSNMNWYANGGGWDILSYYDFTVGPGVYFIWR